MAVSVPRPPATFSPPVPRQLGSLKEYGGRAIAVAPTHLLLGRSRALAGQYVAVRRSHAGAPRRAVTMHSHGAESRIRLFSAAARPGVRRVWIGTADRYGRNTTNHMLVPASRSVSQLAARVRTGRAED